ncbi:MAG: RagB/SusD family nutrient uptake outer membrane protein [Dysgonamonadaceae bacterium]|jgi:hypothetical protein|nr:RagB/SusD family nutrient uptake outer membrane protein [Dysgonamonadaceae bacterium]
MKESVKHIMSFLLITGNLMSCSEYLDVVPDDTPTIDDAFSNRATMEKSLFSCYSYLPDPADPYYYPAYFTHYDEFHFGTSTWFRNAPAQAICRGEQNTNAPYMDYWSGGRGGTSLFQGINICNIFIEGAKAPKDITEVERNKWIAEAKFLKAYFHFFLLQLYGPIPLIKENLPLSSSPEEVRIFREPVDECVNYIVQLIDEAAEYLPLTVENPINEDGRITRPIALAIKAKALIWGASKLFNGNQDYKDWVDSRGKQLIPYVYSKEKWEIAADAIKEAIDVAHSANYRLYTYNKATSPHTYNMNDSLVRTMTPRKAVTDKWNSGVIWSSMESFADGKSGITIGTNTSNMQKTMYPIIVAGDLQGGVSHCYASFEMAELFYTKKGIPTDEDPEWDYEGRYKPRIATIEANHQSYIATGNITAAINFDREARFYGNLGFDRGFYEIATTTVNGGKSFTPYLSMRSGETGHLQNTTGYYIKKLVAFETSCSNGTTVLPYAGEDYRFPLLRLADLYLLYSEALNEVKEKPDGEVYFWIDSVRSVAKLNGVVESWQTSNFPNRPADKDEMRKIIQRERMIELSFEGQRFWDIRRWKLAEEMWTMTARGWNNAGSTPETYYTLRNIATARKFTSKEYLWPVKLSELRVNTNLEQTWGW